MHFNNIPSMSTSIFSNSIPVIYDQEGGFHSRATFLFFFSHFYKFHRKIIYRGVIRSRNLLKKCIISLKFIFDDVFFFLLHLYCILRVHISLCSRVVTLMREKFRYLFYEEREK